MDEDFRSRTGRSRRAKTGARLLSAVFQVVDEHGVGGLSVDSIRNVAKLSRGSFYNYFETLDAFLIDVSSAFGTVINREQVELFQSESNLAASISGYLRYFVHRAVSERSGTALLLRTLPSTGSVNAKMRQRMMATFGAAAAAGEIDVGCLSVAVDVGVGVITAMLRRALDDGPQAERISEETIVLLRGFGVEKRRALGLAHRKLPPMPTTRLRDEMVTNSLNLASLTTSGTSNHSAD